MGNVTLSASEAMVELCRGTWLSNTACEKLYRAELFDGIFFKKGRVHEDVEILHHLFSKARNISCASSVVYHYYMRSDSIMHQDTSKRRMDFFLSYFERYNYLENETAKRYTLKFCIDGSYRILYLSDGFIYDEEDLKLVKSFWEQHKNVDSLGLRYYLKCKYPQLCRFMWVQRNRIRCYLKCKYPKLYCFMRAQRDRIRKVIKKI